MPAAAQVYLYWRSQLSERITMASVVATASDRSSQTSWTWPSPSAPKNPDPTRSCGSRSISSRLIPPSIPTAGNSTWSVRRPVTTNARCAANRAPR